MLSKNVNSVVAIASVLAASLYVSAVDAAEWGSIKGRILVDGTAPKPSPLAVTKDQFCIDKKPENDSIVVGKDNALVNGVVYLRVGIGAAKVAINPEYDAALKNSVTLDNKG